MIYHGLYIYIIIYIYMSSACRGAVATQQPVTTGLSQGLVYPVYPFLARKFSLPYASFQKGMSTILQSSSVYNVYIYIDITIIIIIIIIINHSINQSINLSIYLSIYLCYFLFISTLLHNTYLYIYIYIFTHIQYIYSNLNHDCALKHLARQEGQRAHEASPERQQFVQHRQHRCVERCLVRKPRHSLGSTLLCTL